MNHIIVLNGSRMSSHDELYPYLTEKLDLPRYFGNNLDALWDVMSERSQDTLIFLIHREDLLDGLGAYGEKLIRVFRDLHHTHRGIRFYTVNEDPSEL